MGSSRRFSAHHNTGGANRRPVAFLSGGIYDATGRIQLMPDRVITNSEAAFLKAQEVMPGGVSSPVRAFNAVGGNPLFIKEAKGCWLTDLDGNKYIDYVASYGPLIVGHANERVVAALSKAIGRGTSFGAPTEAEIQLAEAIVSALPAVEMVRFVNSGTEATMSAI